MLCKRKRTYDAVVIPHVPSLASWHVSAETTLKETRFQLRRQTGIKKSHAALSYCPD